MHKSNIVKVVQIEMKELTFFKVTGSVVIPSMSDLIFYKLFFA